MAKEKAKGSIILEVLIVILAIALIATLLYPKRIWQQAAQDTSNCHDNMDRILKAELIYLKYHNTYEDTLEKIFTFLKSDTANRLEMEYIYADTALGEAILKHLTHKYPEAKKKVDNYLADTLLFTILETSKYDSNLANVILKRYATTSMNDTLQVIANTDSSDVWILNRMSQSYSPLELVVPLREDDSLKIVMQRIEPEILIGALVDTLYKNELWASKIDSTAFYTFDYIKQCPTNQKPYHIVVDDTSVIKRVDIFCPIDSLEIAQTKNDFLKYHLGHLRIQNHGNIKAGEKSWVGQ